MRHYPAYRHTDVLVMPWRTFMALSYEAAEVQRRQDDARFLRHRGLLQEWEENREEWLRLQPPPALTERGDPHG